LLLSDDKGTEVFTSRELAFAFRDYLDGEFFDEQREAGATLVVVPCSSQITINGNRCRRPASEDRDE